MSSTPVEIDPETFTFTIKGIRGMEFALTDLNLDFDHDEINIDVHGGQADWVFGLSSYTVTIEARRVYR